MILSPDSISYINGSNMATPYFVSLINILMHIEGFFYKDKIVFLKYLTILIYAFAVFIISKSLYQNKKKYISVIIIPILWSVGFFTKYFNYVLTDGISGALILLSFGAFLNLSINKRSSFYYYLFLISCILICFIRPALIIFFVIPVLIFFKKDLRDNFKILNIFLICISSSFVYLFLTYFFFSAPQQLGPVIQPLTFNYKVDLKNIPEKYKEDYLEIQDSYQPFIKEYESLSSSSEKYIYKMLKNIQISRTGVATIVDKVESDYLSNTDYSNAERILQNLAINKIINNPLSYITEVAKNSYFTFKIYGDWYRNSFLPEEQLFSIYENSYKQSLKIDETFNIKLQHVNQENLRINQFISMMFSFTTIFPDIFDKSYIFLILIIILTCFFLFGIFKHVSFYQKILFGCFIYIVSVIIFQNLIFPTIPRLISVIFPITVLMLISMICIPIEYLKKIYKNEKKHN